MPRHEVIQEVLDAFLGLFTQPFEQDLKASVEAAATAILLAGLAGSALLVNGGIRAVGEFVGSSFVLVLVWMLLTATMTKKERRNLMIARNLSVLSFWVAATLVLVFAVELVRPDPLDGAIRRGIVAVVLLLLVPMHMRFNLPVWPALKICLPLWISTVFLAWMTL